MTDLYLSQQSILTQDPHPAVPRKAKSHRKRHIPPGPAGVWFQASSSHNTVTHNADEQLPSSGTTADNTLVDDVTACPAWMMMQLQLPHLMTPMFPPFCTTTQRYQSLRQILPNDYALIPELTSSTTQQHPLRLSKKMLVLVHAVHSHINVDWTVELRDETGASISAWLAPSLVQAEQEGAPDKVRAGVVWCLQEQVAILPSQNQKKQWLLISNQSIVQYWVPPKVVPNHVYVEWINKRSRLPGSLNTAALNANHQSMVVARGGGHDDNEISPHDQEEEEEEMEVEQPIIQRQWNPTCSQPPPYQSQEEEINKEMLTADFGSQTVPFLHRPTTALAPQHHSPPPSNLNVSTPETVDTIVPSQWTTSQPPPHSLSKKPSSSTRKNPYSKQCRQTAAANASPTHNTAHTNPNRDRPSQQQQKASPANSVLPNPTNQFSEFVHATSVEPPSTATRNDEQLLCALSQSSRTDTFPELSPRQKKSDDSCTNKQPSLSLQRFAAQQQTPAEKAVSKESTTPKRDRSSSKSPKGSTSKQKTAWWKSGNSATIMMDMLEDDDTMAQPPPPTLKDDDKAPKQISAFTSSLFQASSLTGMDDMFDD